MRMRFLFQGMTLAALLMLVACASKEKPAQASAPGEFHKVEGPGIENFYLLGGRVYSGSAPEGTAGFATLRDHGIKTIISVDGSVPDVELATKYHLRYVHIPVGYDGISHSNALLIAKAVATLPGPIYVHCHHGLHRGPAAAAIACESAEAWTQAEAEAWLRAAGTSTNYPGLYRSVREFQPPSISELGRVPAKFVPRNQTPDLVNTMVKVDEHFDVLKTMQKNGFKPLAAHPDVTAVGESLALYELFHEAHRNQQGAGRGAQLWPRWQRLPTVQGHSTPNWANLQARLNWPILPSRP